MNKLEKLKNKLTLLSDEQLDIIERLINSWNPKDNKLETDDKIVKEIYEKTVSPIEDPLKNYSKEELLEEYGVLFYNEKQNFSDNSALSGIDISYNFEKEDTVDSFNNVTTPLPYDNSPSDMLETSKYDNLDVSALISKKPAPNNIEKENVAIDDFDPLFPDTDFDSLTGLNKSKYDDLDFSALISKKN